MRQAAFLAVCSAFASIRRRCDLGRVAAFRWANRWNRFLSCSLRFPTRACASVVGDHSGDPRGSGARRVCPKRKLYRDLSIVWVRIPADRHLAVRGSQPTSLGFLTSKIARRRTFGRSPVLWCDVAFRGFRVVEHTARTVGPSWGSRALQGRSEQIPTNARVLFVSHAQSS